DYDHIQRDNALGMVTIPSGLTDKQVGNKKLQGFKHLKQTWLIVVHQKGRRFQKMERTVSTKVKEETTDGQMDKRDMKLYGDLCHKLLSTPVTEIFSGSFKSGVSTSSPANDVIPGLLHSHMNGVTLNIPSYRSPTSLPSITGSPEIKPEIFGGLYSQSGVLDSMAYLGASTSFTPVTSPNEMKPV
ncbi:hypothetical protein MAR_006093, partial [Mya arenaria]